MLLSLSMAFKRYHVARNFLLILMVLAFLLVAYSLRGYLPGSWFQSFGFSPVPSSSNQPPAQPLQFATTPAAMNGMPGLETPSPAVGKTAVPEVTLSPAAIKPSSGGLITVVTITPTSYGPTRARPTQAPTLGSPTQTPTLGIPSPTILPTATLSPTSTPVKVVPSISPDASPNAGILSVHSQEIGQALQVFQSMLQAIHLRQPTTVELTVVRAQVSVIDQRMEIFLGTIQPSLTQPVPTDPDVRTYLEYSAQLVRLMRQSLNLVQTVLSNSTPDKNSIDQTLQLIEEFQNIIRLIPEGVPAAQVAPQYTATVTATPTRLPSQTPPPLSTRTPPVMSSANEEIKQLQTIVNQMAEIVREIQILLEQMQK